MSEQPLWKQVLQDHMHWDKLCEEHDAIGSEHARIAQAIREAYIAGMHRTEELLDGYVGTRSEVQRELDRIERGEVEL